MRCCRSPRLISDFVRPLERPEWNFFAEACKPLQFILGALGHTEIAMAVRSSDLLECCAASLEAPDRQGNRAVGDPLFQGLQEPTSCNRAGTRNCGSNARE